MIKLKNVVLQKKVLLRGLQSWLRFGSYLSSDCSTTEGLFSRSSSVVHQASIFLLFFNSAGYSLLSARVMSRVCVLTRPIFLFSLCRVLRFFPFYISSDLCPCRLVLYLLPCLLFETCSVNWLITLFSICSKNFAVGVSNIIVFDWLACVRVLSPCCCLRVLQGGVMLIGFVN